MDVFSWLKNERMFDEIRYLIMLKSNSSDIYSDKTHNWSWWLVILVKHDFNKSCNNYYYKCF